MKETNIIDTKDLTGKSVELFGWVANRRDHGKLIFIDLRDRTGIIQVVFSPDTPGYETAQQLRNEWVVKISGMISERPEKMRNPEIPTGSIELQPTDIEVLNEGTTSPMPLDTNGYEIGEDIRNEYRYLDLRRERLSRNMKARHDGQLFIRNWLDSR